MANAVWSATPLAQDENSVRAAALSVRQRKLLALLNAPMSVDSLSTMSGLPHPEVETTLTRFAKLGLAIAKNDSIGAPPSAFRPSSFSDAASSSSSGSKMPIIVGGVALTAVAAAIWWFTRSAPASNPPSAPAASVAAGKAPAAPGPAPLAAPGDVSTTNVFVSGSATTPAAPNPADAAKLATAAKEREAASRETAKNAKQPVNTPAAAATTPPAAAPTAAPAPGPATTASAAPAAATTPPPPAPATATATATPPAPAPTTTPAPAPAATQVAAAPAPRPATPPAAPREGALISRVEPGFPRNADVDRGTVRARLTVNATGAVTNVEIVESNPPRVFDRNVRSALSQWRYEGTGETQTKLVEVQFNR
jgi:TonB family protein